HAVGCYRGDGRARAAMERWASSDAGGKLPRRSTSMEQHHPLRAARGEPAVYQIKVQGQLSVGWGTWFDGMTITQDASGATLITGPVADQAALHGLLRKVRDLGLTLLALS